MKAIVGGSYFHDHVFEISINRLPVDRIGSSYRYRVTLVPGGFSNLSSQLLLLTKESIYSVTVALVKQPIVGKRDEEGFREARRLQLFQKGNVFAEAVHLFRVLPIPRIFEFDHVMKGGLVWRKYRQINLLFQEMVCLVEEI